MDNKDLYKIHDLIIKNAPFALVRYGDGEFDILAGIACNRQGFKFNPKCTSDRNFRKELRQSLFGEKSPQYLVGISEKNLFIKHWLIKKTIGTVIPACIFLNQNYPLFLSETVPLLNKYPIILVCNEKADIFKLPFVPEFTYRVKNNAWRENYDYAEKINQQLINKEKHIVLVSAGPWSNVLIYNLWKMNRNNWYINSGSVFDPYFFGVNTRQYHERLFKNE